MSAVQRWLYRLRAAVDHLGPVGGIGLALLAGCAVFYGAAVQPAADELASMQELRNQEELARRSGRVVLDTPAQLREFVAFFPEFDSNARWLGLVFGAARQEGLELAQGTYRLQPDEAIGLASYQVTLPVRGSYPQIRRFLGRVLNDVPAVSLENVTFQRERAADGMVEARVVIVLHVREGGMPQRPDAVPDEAPPSREAQHDSLGGVLARTEERR